MRLIPIRQSAAPRKLGAVARMRRLFYGFLALLAASLILAFDTTWPVIHEVAFTVFEFAEQEVDEFFVHSVGLSHYYAQMATAWLGFLLLLVFGILMIRKAFRLTLEAKAKLPAWREHQKEVARSWWEHLTDAVLSWWNTLSWPRRIGLLLAGTLFAIPFFWALSLAVVTLISMFI